MSDVMKVLSLWQPWATLCVAPDPAVGRPPKEYETRHWRPDHPMPLRVAIHATQKSDRATYDLLRSSPFKDCLERCGFFAGDARPFVTRGHPIPRGLTPLPFGAIVGVATVIGVHRTDTVADIIERGSTMLEFALGDWSPGRFAWKLVETAMLPEPIAFRGRQSPLYPVPGDILELIAAQLQAAEVQHA